ncbi:uncharacterized protein LOC106058626 isoform X1 [Biomphalaria glabrata]|uniref:Uncharacterized protein LOC106058626 isoform X1 n=1 Tax=Biomphalaria glabrata TaxID=6526 RepID=A0A9W3BAS8_BIOGL|nr:uncharacterized protein LOC106058626 isoform X1 [Biomphalaria glabrata]XP_055896548.1 uncharacterized protein LOC106058626 isoform X1 [Biomphalaria glabrata]XP_055896549.1 uncharacterized protein LOC106058626 isoform X1 [Biomphalaria glabrata]
MDSSQPDGLVMKEIAQVSEAGGDIVEPGNKTLLNGKTNIKDVPESHPSTDFASVLAKENSPPHLSPISSASSEDTVDLIDSGTEKVKKNDKESAAVSEVKMNTENVDTSQIDSLSATRSEVKSDAISEINLEKTSEKIFPVNEDASKDIELNDSDKSKSSTDSVPTETLSQDVPKLEENDKEKSEALNPAQSASLLDNSPAIQTTFQKKLDSELETSANTTLAKPECVEKGKDVVPAQIFEDITEDEESGEEAFENIELELDDLIDHADLSKSNLSSTSKTEISSKHSNRTNNETNHMCTKTTASTVIQDSSNTNSENINTVTQSDPKNVNGLGPAKKPKVTARKSGKPESLPLKINLHPIKNITMTLTEVEKALDVPSREVDSLRLVKNSDMIKSETYVTDGNGALRTLAGQKKKRRKNTYDFPGCKKKSKKFKSDESVGSSADSVSLSDSDFPEAKSKETIPAETALEKDVTVKPEKTESALDILTKNAALGFVKKPKPSSHLSTPRTLTGKSGKMKSVLEMLHERSRQKAESDDSKTSPASSLTSTPTTNTTTTTNIVSSPSNKPSVEGVKRKGTPRKRKEDVICLSETEDISELVFTVEGKKRKISSEVNSVHPASPLQTKTSPSSAHSPVVVVVTQHSVSPGLRSLLPRQSFVTAGTASTGSTLPHISTLPIGAKAISMSTLMPKATALPKTPQGPQPTMTFFAPVASVGSGLTPIPVTFAGANLVVAQQKSPFSSSSKSVKNSSPSNLVLPSSSASKSKKKDFSRHNSDSLRALLVGQPYTFPKGPPSNSPQLPAAPVLFQMITTPSGTNFVPVAAQPMAIIPSSSAPKMLKPAVVPKSNFSIIKSHPANALNGVSCLTPPKTPESDGSSEVAVAATLSRPVSGQVEDSEVIPLCCCKINGASFSKLFSGVTYCQALDTVDNKVLGCCNKVTNSQLVRPGVKIPFMAVCEVHRKRLKLHQCCPGCGHFCSQGKFQQCRKEGKSSVHNFHKQCMFYRGGKYYCPHCGEETCQREVELKLNDNKSSDGATPSSLGATKKEAERRTARIGFIKSKSTNDQPTEKSIALKNSRIINIGALPLGPDHQLLTKLCRCSTEDRPKKYRSIPKDLYTPALEGDMEKVFYLLMDGLDPNKRYEEHDDQTALHAAATIGSLGIVFILEQFGSEIHAQDRTLRTPMMCAAENGHVSVVQFLIKSGAKVEDRGEDGMTSLHYAAKAGYTDVIQHILETEQVDVNIQDDGGWTPIIWATESQLTDVVKYLIKQGGDPNKKDNEENTGLHWAAFSGSLEIAKMFIDLGCEIDAINEHGDRPLHIAARQDHYDLVVLLLARGADVDTKNNKDETPVECCMNKSGQVWMALKVNQQLRSFAARKLIRPEKLVERDITMGREKNPIACVNAEDNEACPTDYLYVTENVETSPLNVNYVITSLQSCRCKDDCSSMYCVCGHSSVRCWYDKMGRLVDEVNLLEPPLVFECNRACRCWVNCNNRVVQNGITCRLQMFRTNGRGWGVRALMDIPKGTFVCEYIGELISDSEADRREDDSYLFDLDNKDGDTYCIDARKYGNVSRFINHLCEPNLIPVKVFVEHQDLRFPRICLFSSKEIKAYEELGFDYGEKFWMIKWKHFTCACNSQKCKYSSETIKKTLADYKLRYPDEVVDT